MIVDIAALLHKAEQVLDPESADKAAALLKDPETRLLDEAPSHEEVKTLLPTLRVRLAHSVRTGIIIYGAAKLAAILEKMDGSAVVIGYGFISPRAAGNVYLADENGHALGIAIVDRQDAAGSK